MKHQVGFVAIIGRPNTGKSTLLNEILGVDLSIVTSKAQTTRDQIKGIYNDPKKGQIIFVDSPGIHHAKEGGLNQAMMNEVKISLQDPSAVWYLLDPKTLLKRELAVLEELKGVRAPIFLLGNKMDLCKGKRAREEYLALIQEVGKKLTEQGNQWQQPVRLVSALKAKGTDDLLKDTWALLPQGELYFPMDDAVTDRPMRFFAGEIIRKHLYLCLGEEIPYSCAVKVEKFDESGKIPRVEAKIFVERDSQKGMVVGSGGSKIKQISSQARQEIQELSGHGKIFLGLKVDVLPKWTRQKDHLKNLGYQLPPTKETRT